MSDQTNDNGEKGFAMTRREFLAKAATATAATAIVPRQVLGGPGFTPPSDRINLAVVGVGGQGTFNMREFMKFDDVQIVSVCDVNALCDYTKFYFGGVAGREPAKKIVNDYYGEKAGNNAWKGCSAYADFREMLGSEKDIDAVVVATTDNNHAIASMAAMKKGMHVYCEKPLSHDVYEARMMTEAARRYNVKTQMGNQGHAMEGNRLVKEWVDDGAIGDVVEVHVWTNRPFGYWPQGVERPLEIPSVPRELDWNLWLGPAPFRPYHPIYVPFNWRGRWDFGTGALGDMGCHLIDTPHFVLDLPQPVTVEASCTPVNDESGPHGAIIYYEFPVEGRDTLLKLTWYDGGLLPQRPKELEEGRKIDKDGGSLFIGTKGKIICGTYGENPRLIPETAMRAYTRPPKTLPRPEDIRREWIDACKGGPSSSSNFDVSGPLTEMVLLGNLAVRRNGKTLNWDSKNLRVTNDDEANQYVKREYHGSWTL